MRSGTDGFLIRSKRPCEARRGLSTLEVLGWLVAMIVGVLAGAAYVGMDMLALAGLADESVDVSPAESAAAETDAFPDALSSQGDESAATAEGLEPGSTRPSAAGRATLTYWNRLRTVIQAEQQARLEGERQAGGNPRAVLRARGGAYQAAAQSIRDIRADLADPESQQLAEQIAIWYEHGAELAEEGASLEEGELSTAQGPVGRRWHAAQKQHREESDLLSRKCGSLRGKLTARYGVRFAELQ